MIIYISMIVQVYHFVLKYGETYGVIILVLGWDSMTDGNVNAVLMI